MSRLLPRYTDDPIHHDPLEAKLAQIEAEQQAAIEAIHDGTHPNRQPLNPRGWPISTRGVAGTSPGTDPLTETIYRMSIRRR